MDQPLRRCLAAISDESRGCAGWRLANDGQAADVRTVGLGGDSHVRLSGSGKLIIGPHRVVPLCLLASEYPQIVGELRQQVAVQTCTGLDGQFVLAQRQKVSALSERDRMWLDRLGTAPRSLLSPTEEMHYRMLVVQQTEEVVARRLVLWAGFTPTDALHVLGRFELWDAEASRLGAGLLAAYANLSPEAFCEQVVSEVSDKVTKELISKALSDEAILPDWEHEPVAAALLTRAMEKVPESDLGCKLTLHRPVAVVGAPVEAYLPRTVQQLHTELIIPPHAEVANAVGAVCCSPRYPENAHSGRPLRGSR